MGVNNYMTFLLNSQKYQLMIFDTMTLGYDGNVSYNNAFIFLHGLPMRCSSLDFGEIACNKYPVLLLLLSGMFASSGGNQLSNMYQEKRIHLTMQITCFAKFDCA